MTNHERTDQRGMDSIGAAYTVQHLAKSLPDPVPPFHSIPYSFPLLSHLFSTHDCDMDIVHSFTEEEVEGKDANEGNERYHKSIKRQIIIFYGRI